MSLYYFVKQLDYIVYLLGHAENKYFLTLDVKF